MREGVLYACLTFSDKVLVVKQIAKLYESVGIVGRLLVAPPVGAVGLGVAGDVAVPQAGVIGI